MLQRQVLEPLQSEEVLEPLRTEFKLPGVRPAATDRCGSAPASELSEAEAHVCYTTRISPALMTETNDGRVLFLWL